MFNIDKYQDLPEAESGNFTKNAVYAFAEELSIKARDSEDRLELANFVTEFGGEIEYVEQETWSTVSGSLFVPDEESFLILLPKTTSRLRDNFTIAHELGHYFLHSEMGDKPIKANRDGSDRCEWEANWFASAFLMPKAIINRRALKTAKEISSFFDVSMRAAEIRMDNLSD